jgi:hypothetical protein
MVLEISQRETASKISIETAPAACGLPHQPETGKGQEVKRNRRTRGITRA